LHYNPAMATDTSIVVYRISGALFFGAVSTVSAVLDRVADRYGTLVIDFAQVPFLDSTAANAMEGIVRKAKRSGVTVFITGASTDIRRTLETHGVAEPPAIFRPSIETAVREARNLEN
jgi:SulP family sulfate permease